MADATAACRFHQAPGQRAPESPGPPRAPPPDQQETGEMPRHPVPGEGGLGQEGKDRLEIGGVRVSDLDGHARLPASRPG